MHQRNRGYSQSQDWDSMRDDYNVSTYAPQYNDGHSNFDTGVQLNHSRLYVTCIPSDLNEDGLHSLFSKYGSCKTFLSHDPTKRFALITYESSSNAKMAMMKLNNMEPFNLQINISHKKGNQNAQQSNRTSNNMDDSFQENTNSISSRGRYNREQEEFSNGDGDMTIDSMGDVSYNIQKNLGLEDRMKLEELKMQELNLKEEKIRCQQRLLLLERTTPGSKTGISRSILPDGRIVVKNNNERVEHQHSTFNSAAGDSREGSRACVWCGAPADSFCARCGLARYCGPRCQRADWARRHRAVCHNLARLNDNPDTKENEVVPDRSPTEVPSSLRRPHSPARPNKSATQGQKKVPRNPNLKNQNIRKPMQNRHNKPVVVDDEEEESFELKEPKPQPEPKAVPESKPREPSPRKPEAVRTFKPKMPSFVKPVNDEPATTIANATAEVKVASSKTLTVSDTTPIRKMVPKNYVIETLSPGDAALLSVDAPGAACGSRAPGYVCLALHESCERGYQLLCGDYGADCEADGALHRPNLGELFSYCNPEDGAWYRARLLEPTSAALIDSSKVVTLTGNDKCRKMTPKYEAIPEFSCLLSADVQIGENLKCTLLSASDSGYTVRLEDAESGAARGEGRLTRWRPAVSGGTPGVSAMVIPEVPRPEVEDNSKVVIVETSALDKVFVRPSDAAALRKYDAIVQDVLQYGMTAKPIEEPPQKGQIVIGKFKDGNCYRALCKRTNVSQNKYLLEYIEFGNTDINTKDTIYPCPVELNLESSPTLVSLVKLKVSASSLTGPATEYLEDLKDNATELVLNIPDGSKTAPSGSEVNLTISKNKESVNRKIEEFCTPGWKKIEAVGGDVIHCPSLMFTDLEHLELPEEGCELDVLDASPIRFGSLNVCRGGLPYAQHVFTTLSKQMEDYCNSEIGREPYMPKMEELCIAQCPPYTQWFRAVLCELPAGPGSAIVRVLYVDYGNMEMVPAASLRKMMPEFVRGQPALATQVEIKGFPKDPTDEMVAKALMYMKFNDEGRGVLTVSKCIKNDELTYIVEAPDLLKAIGV